MRHGRSTWHALVWLAWRRQRLLLVTAALAFVAIPWGLLAFGAIASGPDNESLYDAKEALFTLSPTLFAFFLWPIAGVAVGVQAVAEERRGQDDLLAAQPVARTYIWLVTLASGLGCITALVTASLGSWWVVVLTQGLEGQLARVLSEPNALPAVAAAVVTACVAMLAGAVVRQLGVQGLPALVVGVMVLAAWAGCSFVLARSIVHAPLAALAVPGLGGPLLGLAISFALAASGEPSGRDRLRRAVVPLAVGSVLLVAAFLVTVPVALRAKAGRPQMYTWLELSPRGHRALIKSTPFRSARVVQLETGQQHFLNPEVFETSWSGDGALLALVTNAGPYGTQEAVRVEIREGSSGELSCRIPAPRGALWPSNLHWEGDMLLVPWRMGRELTVLHTYDTQGTEIRPRQELPGSFARCAGLVRGRLLVLLGGHPEADRVLLSLDPLGEDAPELLATDDTTRTWLDAQVRLSPSQRFWIRDVSTDEGARSAVVDLLAESDDDAPFIEDRPVLGALPRWLAGDRLVWVESEPGWHARTHRMFVAGQGEAPTLLEEWNDVSAVSVRAEPGGSRVVVVVREEISSLFPFTGTSRLYDTTNGSWRDLDALAEQPPSWSGPGVLTGMVNSKPVYWRLDEDETPRRL